LVLLTVLGEDRIPLSSKQITLEILIPLVGPKRDEETGDWRKLHNEELHNLYSSPNIIRMLKSRRIKWAGNVA
jgi:hypothetical protein